MSDRRPRSSSSASSPANKRPRPQRPQRAGGSSPARAGARDGVGGGSRPPRQSATTRDSASRGSTGPSQRDAARTGANGRSTSESRPAGRPHVPLAFGYGIVAALASLIVLMVPVFAAWTLDAQSTSSWNDTLGVAIYLWALAHRGHVVVDGIELTNDLKKIDEIRRAHRIGEIGRQSNPAKGCIHLLLGRP